MEKDEIIDNVENKEDNIIRLKDWLDKQPHLPKDMDPQILRAFVYGTKSLELAKQKLDKFCTMRGKLPKIFEFSNRDPLDVNFRESSFKIFYLPEATAEGYRSIFICNKPEDFDKLSFPQLIIKMVMLMELGMLLWPEMTGFCIVFDLISLPNSSLTKVSPNLAAAYFSYFQEAYPFKFKKHIYCNTPKFMDVIVNVLLKPFLKPKIFGRMLVSDDSSSLPSYFGADVLPKEYGGKEESIQTLDEIWHQKLVEYRDWFQKTSLLISDESKRPPDELNTYGTQGTFRTLAFD